MKISVNNTQNSLQISTQAVKTIVKSVIAGEGQNCDEVSIYFVSTEEICQLHKDFFDDPTPTDCISFPLDEEDVDNQIDYRILGDVFVCPQTALEYAEANGTDPYDETALYVIHGLLHLMGYDDLEENKVVLMREAEDRHLKKIKEMKCSLMPKKSK